MDAALVPPRALTDEEASSLRELLRSELITIRSSADDEDDAEALLDYANDMIEEGDSVGHVVEELTIMEMPVCDESAAKRLGEIITDFFLDLDGGALREERGKKRPSASKWKKVAPAPPPPVKKSTPPSPNAHKWTRPAPIPPKSAPPPPAKAPPPARPSSPSPSSTPTCASTYASASASLSASTSASVSTAGEDNASETDPELIPVEKATKTLSIAARRATYCNSYQPPASQPSFPSSSAGRRSTVSSYGGKSWAAKERKGPVAEIKTDPAGPGGGGDSEPAPEPRRSSLKDRLAAYQGASSPSSNSKVLPNRHKNDSWLQGRMRARGEVVKPIKEHEKDGDGDDGERIVDFTPVMSLRERMAAFQGGGGNAVPISH